MDACAKKITLWLVCTAAAALSEAWVPSVQRFAGGSLNSVAASRETDDQAVYSKEELKLGIAGFYDRSSKLWESVWGEHMHHGYYVPPDRKDHKQAQLRI